MNDLYQVQNKFTKNVIFIGSVENCTMKMVDMNIRLTENLFEVVRRATGRSNGFLKISLPPLQKFPNPVLKNMVSILLKPSVKDRVKDYLNKTSNGDGTISKK